MSTPTVEGRTRSSAPGLSLPLVQLGVLATLADYPREVGAYVVAKALAGMFPATSVYSSLPKMVELGLLDSALIENERGEPKRVYWPSPEGSKALKQWAEETLPTPLLAPSREALIWISTARARKPHAVLEGLRALEEELQEQDLELKLAALKTRRQEYWSDHKQLETDLERAALDASRQFLAVARGLFEERVAALPTKKAP